MKKILVISILFFVLVLAKINAQNLDSLLNVELKASSEKEYVQATFKGTRIVLGQSIENKAHGELNFMISHHFGYVNSGIYEFYGLDHAEMRLGFEYGITDRLTVGIGRSSYNKVYDGSFKLKLLQQSTGTKAIPLSISLFSSMAAYSYHWPEPNRNNLFSSRLSYAFELLIARKMNSRLSLQLTPSLIHRNLVKTSTDQNDVYSIGVGERMKLSKRFSLNAEYYYLLPGKTADDFYNSFSLGIDIETGGHVFQIFLINSSAMLEQYFIPETAGSWAKGDISLGFNISRNFTIIKHNKIDKNDGY